MHTLDEFFNGYKNNLNSLSQAYDSLLSRRISYDIAKQFIEYYQSTSSDQNLKYVWMDDIIFNVLGNNGNGRFSGLRLYCAKYKQGVGEVGKTDEIKADALTIIAVFTEKIGDEHKDIPKYCFDYSKPHPPYGNGGIGG